MLPSTPLKALAEQADENTCPNSQQPLRSAIRARLEHLSMDDMGPMPPTADEAFAESVSVLISGPANALPSSGWQAWPVASEAHRGLVYLPCEGCFAYHSAVEADDDCVVHFGAPRAGRAHVYPRAALLQPPFSAHHICTAPARQTEAEAAPKQSVEPLTPTTDSEAAWAAGFASKQAVQQQAEAEAVRLRQAVQQPPSKPKPAAPSSKAPLTPTSASVSRKTASRISAPVSTATGLSELQIASRISQLALFDEPALVLPL